jgi:hypothetical protein
MLSRAGLRPHYTSHWDGLVLRGCLRSTGLRFVGQPILAAAGFQPAPGGSDDPHMAEKPPGKAAAGKIACPTLKGILVVLPAADH